MLLKRLISRFVVYVLLREQKCLQLPLKYDAGITISNVKRQPVAAGCRRSIVVICVIIKYNLATNSYIAGLIKKCIIRILYDIHWKAHDDIAFMATHRLTRLVINKHVLYAQSQKALSMEVGVLTWKHL